MNKSMIHSMIKATALRIVAFGLTFAYVLPAALGALLGKGAFVFHGSFLVALAYGFGYLVFVFAAAGLQMALLGSHEKTLRERGILDRISSTVCFAASTLFVVLASALLPSVLSVTSVLAAVVSGAVCLSVMAGTLFLTSPCYRKKFMGHGGCKGKCNGSGCQGKGQGGCNGKCRGGCNHHPNS